MALHLRPGLTGPSPGDGPVQLATVELIADLRTAGLPVTGTDPDAAGATGVLSDPAVTIGGSSTAAGALVRIVNQWLRRDRRRSLTIIRTAGGTPETIQIQGDAISDRTLHEAVQKLLDDQDGESVDGPV